MSEGITDPTELMKIANLKSVAHVALTLDKISLRKEWHDALTAAGMDLGYLASKIKGLIDSENEKSVATGLKMALTSVGLNKYEEAEGSGKGWEEAIIELASKNKAIEATETSPGRYEVKEPEIPDEVKKKWEDEKSDADNIYGRTS